MDHDEHHDHHEAPTLAEIEQLQHAIARLNETLRESIALFAQMPTAHIVRDTDGSVEHLNHTLEHTQELLDHLPPAAQLRQLAAPSHDSRPEDDGAPA